MAKKKEEKGEQGNLLSAYLTEAQNTFGENVFMGNDADAFICGIRLPCLALMYVMDSTIYPLSKAVGIAGPSQSSKSALGFEILRWVCDAGGYGEFAECEGGKYSPTLMRSILTAKHMEEHILINQCHTIQEGQKALMDMVSFVKEKSDKNALMGLMLDSLSGSDTDEAVEKLEKEGSAGRAHPINALSWTNFFKGFCAGLIGWPIAFLFINHRKEKPNAMPGLPNKKTTPGGDAQWFHASTYLYVDRIKKEAYKTREDDGEVYDDANEVRRIQIKCEKNSMGTDGRLMTVDFRWYHDVDNNQISVWDWHGADARFLVAMQKERVQGVELSDIIDADCKANRFSSKVLGVENLSASDFGKAFQNNMELFEKVRLFFHIKDHPVYSGRMPEPRKLKTPKAKESKEFGSGEDEG